MWVSISFSCEVIRLQVFLSLFTLTEHFSFNDVLYGISYQHEYNFRVMCVDLFLDFTIIRCNQRLSYCVNCERYKNTLHRHNRSCHNFFAEKEKHKSSRLATAKSESDRRVFPWLLHLPRVSR